MDDDNPEPLDPRKGHGSGPIDDAFMFDVLGRESVQARLARVDRPTHRRCRSTVRRRVGPVLPRQAADGEHVPERYDIGGLQSRPNLVLFGDPQSIRSSRRCCRNCRSPGRRTNSSSTASSTTRRRTCRCSSTRTRSTPNTLRRHQQRAHVQGGRPEGDQRLLYPRLGDWAVIKPTPTEKDPAAYEVVAAGLFDENWQFTGPVAEGAKLEKLWGEGEFTEGPAEGPDGCIYFSDIGNRIMKFDPKTGKTTAFRDPSGRSNGLKFDAKGRLVACEGANTGGGRRISITEKDGTVKTLADSFEGKRFNSPNDLTLDAQGPRLLQRSALRRRRETRTRSRVGLSRRSGRQR